MKVCSRCGDNKPLDAFQRDPRYRMGVTGWCKTCRAENAAQNKDRIRHAPKVVVLEKRCRRCGETKVITHFPRTCVQKDGYAGTCKACRNDQETPKRMTSDRPKRNHLWSHYRMTPEDFKQLFDAQGGRCGICENPLTRPTIDHCHRTGYVRSLLCHRCNIHLRTLEDAEFVRRALTYLARHRAASPPQHGFQITPYRQRGRSGEKARLRERRLA